jgi:hypothetical protein
VCFPEEEEEEERIRIFGAMQGTKRKQLRIGLGAK